MTETDEPLLAVLREGQRIGAIGPAPLTNGVAHARRFVRALRPDDRSVLDLGSGGGLPGLVIAWDRPDLQVTLVDRRSKRTDHLQRSVRRLGIAERVRVITADVHTLAREPGHAARYDVVTARSFGPPDATVRAALPFLRSTGIVVISNPPGLDHQQAVLDAGLHAHVEVSEGSPGVSVFRRRT